MRIQRIHVFLYSSISRKEKYPCSHGNTQKKFRFAFGVIPPAFTLGFCFCFVLKIKYKYNFVFVFYLFCMSVNYNIKINCIFLKNK